MIDFSFLDKKPVAVLGLGKSGLSVVSALRAAYIPVTAWDDKSDSRNKAAALGANIDDLSTIPLDQYQLMVLSPGIPHTHPKPHPAVENARRYYVPIVGDIDLLAQSEQDAFFIGVTGTNGKSTTTALIAHIMEKNGKAMQVGGNLGTPVMDFAPATEGSAIVLELSSYQLETTPNLKCDVAVFLNISADHLDRHGDIDGYIAAKENIFKNATVAIIGQDDEYSVTVTKRAQSSGMKIIPISSQKRSPGGVTFLSGTLFDDINHQMFDISNSPSLPGSHNGQNAAAAYAACLFYGLNGADIVGAMQSFPGLPHRQQLIATINGINYINDSKATNADAAARALACYDDIYWIIGGQAKETGLNGLEQYAPRIRQAYIIGQASDEFAAWCASNNVPYQSCGTLDVAVKAAATDANAGHIKNSVVLLSPACASWDQFDSYEHRGAVFTELVHRLQS